MENTIRTSVRMAVVAVALIASTVRAEIAVFQQGSPTPRIGGTYAGTQDTRLDWWNDTPNYGNEVTFAVYPYLGLEVEMSVIKFDISALQGRVDTVNSVTLRLIPATVGAAGDGTVQMYRVSAANADWTTQGAGYSSGLYRHVDTTTNWAGSPGKLPGTGYQGLRVAGTDYYSSVLASVGWTPATPVNDINNPFDLVFSDASFISQWLLSANNEGLLLRSLGSGGNTESLYFNSSEAETPTFRPMLIIDYTPVPEPASFGLLALAAGLMARRRR